MKFLIKTCLILVLLTTVCSTAIPQPPDSLWSRTYLEGNYRRLFEVFPTDDGNMVLTGTNGEGLSAVKIESDGDTLWTLQNYIGEYNECRYVLYTSTGDFVAVGTHEVFIDSFTTFAAKFDSEGNELWFIVLPKIDIKEITETSDGNYIFVGIDENSEASGYAIKLSSDGAIIWQKYPGALVVESIAHTSDGGYILAGWSFGDNSADVYIAKTDNELNVEWTREYGGEQWDSPDDILQLGDGGYIISGHTGSFGAGFFDAYIIRTDQTGDTLWTRAFGDERVEYCNSITPTNDGGFICIGSSGTIIQSTTIYDIYVVKADSLGNPEWEIIHGGNESDIGRTAIQLEDDRLLFLGTSRSFTSDPHAQIGFYITCYGDDLYVKQNNPPQLENHLIKSIFPNPFNPTTEISISLNNPSEMRLTIFDLRGRQLFILADGKFSSGNHRFTLDASQLASGTYFVEATINGQFQESRKIIMIK